MEYPFVKRVKGQRYDKNLIPGFVVLSSASETPPVGVTVDLEDFDQKLKFKGIFYEVFDGYDPYGLPCKYERWEVITSTHRVPCYRKHAPGQNYVICQSYSYRALPL